MLLQHASLRKITETSILSCLRGSDIFLVSQRGITSSTAFSVVNLCSPLWCSWLCWSFAMIGETLRRVFGFSLTTPAHARKSAWRDNRCVRDSTIRYAFGVFTPSLPQGNFFCSAPRRNSCRSSWSNRRSGGRNLQSGTPLVRSKSRCGIARRRSKSLKMPPPIWNIPSAAFLQPCVKLGEPRHVFDAGADGVDVLRHHRG